MLGIARRAWILLGVGLLLAPALRSSADDGSWTENWNAYMLVQIGQSLHGDVVEPSVQHADRPGRWGVYTQKGDPETTEDDLMPLIRTAEDGGPAGRYGFTTIRVDGTDVIYGASQGGGWIDAPYTGKGVGAGLDPDNSKPIWGNYVIGRYRVTTGNIYVRHTLSIIRDQIRIEVFLRNDDTASHNVGVRHCADTMTDLADSTSYVFIPGRGIVESYNGPVQEMLLQGSEIPDYFEMYDDPKSPKVAIRNTLRLQDATPPDWLALGWWQNIQASDWDYTPVPDRINLDYGWAIRWNPVLLNPGESRTIITYFGMAAASSSWTSTTGTTGALVQQDPFCVAVQGPRALPINYDPAKSPEDMLTSNPFTITAYVYNLYRDTTLSNVNLYLDLPPGLELDEDEVARREITSIAPETEGTPIVWKVRSNGKVSGSLEYTVSVSGTPGLQKTVARQIVIPATSTTSFRRGWQMVSVPFKFSDPRIEQALKFEPDTYRAYYYDPQSVQYQTSTVVSPGKGMWVDSTIDRAAVTIARDAQPMTGSESYRLSLYTGWNQFGNPFLYNIPWGRVKVLVDATVGPVTIEEAAIRNWIRSTIYWYDVDVGEYIYSSNPQVNLEPWRGYWIKALQPCQLIIPPIEQIGALITGSTTRSRAAASEPAASGKDGWKLNLVARAGELADTRSMLGIDTRAADGYDSKDVERPPSPEHYVAISFTHRDWGQNNGNFITDIRRSAVGAEAWEFNVTTDQLNSDVVLTWPTIMEVPKDYSLRLVDVDGSVSRYMRTTSSYQFNSGSDGIRRFKIVAEPGGVGRLLISGLNVNTSRALGGATITYNLSADAAVDVRIKNGAGKMVRKLAEGRGITRGISNLSWNYRDDSGKQVAAGMYVVEIVATTPEGEVVRQPRPFLVAR
ncbi:MAG: hypothetical protein HYX78_13020 [Armatimonadetes bacterium]|nr:hypothetical protein [Armatimonadota bacterium]